MTFMKTNIGVKFENFLMLSSHDLVNCRLGRQHCSFYKPLQLSRREDQVPSNEFATRN